LSDKEVLKIILTETVRIHVIMTVSTVHESSSKECERVEMPMPEEQHSDVSYDEDNVENQDDDEHDDETGPDSDTGEAERP
jgi:hypothetical protein